MKMSNKFLQELYPDMQKYDWRELRFREPIADEAAFLTQKLKSSKKNFPVLRGTLIKTYSYTAPGWEVVNLISDLTLCNGYVPPLYYAAVRINNSNIVTETLCYEKETKLLHPGDDVIIVRKSDNTAYTYQFKHC